MSISVGIIGLPNVGKSTLFNALLKRQVALSANYPFATIEPNVGVVEVPDPRLDRLVELVQSDFEGHGKDIPHKVVPATVRFYDIAGLVKGAHAGEGLGNEFLGHIRSVDALIHVVRDFSAPDVVETGTGDPQEDIEIIDTELMLADIQQLERFLIKLEKQVRVGSDKQLVQKYELARSIKEYLDRGQRWYILLLDEDARSLVKELSLLTAKPVLRVVNIDEDKISAHKLGDASSGQGVDEPRSIHISARIESEISSLSDEDRVLFMKELGIDVSGLDLIIREAYHMLGLHTFFTAGPKEVHAWQFNAGSPAPACAGKIHSDFERGFISAEVVSFADADRLGTYKNAKDHGVLRLEGKDYIVQDGDIIEFRFSV